MHIARWRSLCAASALALATVTGPASAGPADDTLRIAMSEEILNLDYNYTTKREYIILAQLTDATLFELDPETQEVNPSIATGYEWVDDLTLDVTLRDDVLFHDGTPLDAEDVAYTYNWIKNPESESNASGVVDRWLDNAEVTGPNTVRFHLQSVYPLVLRDMANRIMVRKDCPRSETRALDGVSLSVKRGETLALIGESGSGKSTLARILLGLDEPSFGEVSMLGRPLSNLSPMERARFVQPVFQDPYTSLNPRRRLAEIIARPLVLRGEGDSTSRMAAVREAMEHVRLPARLLHAYPSQLSGGQRQRIAIARALVTRPEALICDEPTSALDVSVQAQILELLDDLRAEMGLTCLLITHDMAVVHEVADRVAVMYQGRIVEEGAAAAVLANPTDDYTARLLAAAPRFEQTPRHAQVAQ